jgi:ABC-type arginine transport system permease subunit
MRPLTWRAISARLYLTVTLVSHPLLGLPW